MIYTKKDLEKEFGGYWQHNMQSIINCLFNPKKMPLPDNVIIAYHVYDNAFTKYYDYDEKIPLKDVKEFIRKKRALNNFK